MTAAGALDTERSEHLLVEAVPRSECRPRSCGAPVERIPGYLVCGGAIESGS